MNVVSWYKYLLVYENINIPPHEYCGNAEIEIIRPFLKPVVKYVI
jgi:hypothetical protein